MQKTRIFSPETQALRLAAAPEPTSGRRARPAPLAPRTLDHAPRSYPSLLMDQVMVELGRGSHGEREPINLCQAGSSFDPFEHVDLHLTRDDLGMHRSYADVNGRPSLREAICRNILEELGHELDPRRVCITAGATEALSIAFAMVTRPGGTIILPASHFPPFRSLAHMFGVRCRYAPVTPRGSLDVSRLPDVLTEDTQAIVVNSPSNPHGAVLDEDELADIAALGVPVIFDEVYQALGLEERVPSAITHADRHLVVNSFSKSLSLAGYRVGYLIVPEAQVGLMKDVKSTMAFSTSSASQAICEALLPHWDRLLSVHRAYLRGQWERFASAAASLGLEHRAPPRAGVYGLLDVTRSGRGSTRVAMDLAREWATGTVPGSDFENPDPHYLRVNFAASPTEVEQGLARIAAYLEQCR